MVPRQPTVAAGSTATPSTSNRAPPKASMSKPVAVTITSASSSRPDSGRMPPSVKRAMRSVTAEARPEAMARKRSPSGTQAMRWLHGR